MKAGGGENTMCLFSVEPRTTQSFSVSLSRISYPQLSKKSRCPLQKCNSGTYSPHGLFRMQPCNVTPYFPPQLLVSLPTHHDIFQHSILKNFLCRMGNNKPDKAGELWLRWTHINKPKPCLEEVSQLEEGNSDITIRRGFHVKAPRMWGSQEVHLTAWFHSLDRFHPHLNPFHLKRKRCSPEIIRNMTLVLGIHLLFKPLFSKKMEQKVLSSDVQDKGNSYKVTTFWSPGTF